MSSSIPLNVESNLDQLDSPSKNQPILSVKNLRIGFSLLGEVNEVVKGVSFDIYPKTTLAIVGESGSGKSVSAQAIMGILPANARILDGQILLNKDGNTIVDLVKLNVNSRQYRDIRGGKISIIFQEPMSSLSPLHTIGDQVQEALVLHQKISKSKSTDLTKKMLSLVGFPDSDRAYSSYSFELSGGLRQRAMIAMALVCLPSILIADEPTTALDVTIQAQIIDLLKKLQNELEMSIILITHDLGVVANMADNIMVMYHGKVVESGNAKELLEKPQHPYLQCLLNAVPQFGMKNENIILKPIRAIEKNIGDYIMNHYYERNNLHVKHEKILKENAQQNNNNEKDIILKVKDLNKSFLINASQGMFKSNNFYLTAVDDFTMNFYRGQSFGLVGESGCGKSTFSKMIMRALTPTRGSIEFFDVRKDNALWLDVLNLTKDELMRYRRRVQYIFQDPFASLNPRMTILDILKEPLIVHKIGSPKDHLTIAKELIDMVGLDTRYLNRYPHSFSGGQRQRIAIARALGLCPDLLICDEPVSALDVSIQAQILNLFNDLREQLGLTYIFISHNLAVVDYVADTVGVMAHGRLVEVADREKIFNNPRHPYTKLLLNSVPNVDLNHPIPFKKIREEKGITPSMWPEPFTINDVGLASKDKNQRLPKLTETDKNHWVRLSKIRLETI